MQITVNGRPHEAAETISVAQLLEQLGLAGKPLAVEVNRELVPRQRHADRGLADGDRVEIVTLVGGG
jgi:sulfur carrier protein